MKWTCGVTTVPSRRYTTLPRTLSSLHKAGFQSPRLFVDGADDSNGWAREFQLEKTFHYPPVRAFGNFWLGLLELYLRDPIADLFAMFQDDILLCRNTQQYIEESPKPNLTKPVYFNLFTCGPNEDRIKPFGIGWQASNQLGWGGQALVFPRETMIRMFQSKHLTERPLGMRNGEPCPEKAWRNLDGGVIASVKSFGGIELVHNPSLVFHIEGVSAIGNKPDNRMRQGTWLGEEFDAMTWLRS